MPRALPVLLLALLLLLPLPAQAQTASQAPAPPPPQIIKEQRAKVTHYGAEGNVAPIHTLGCIPLAQVRNEYTAADLYQAVGACVAKDQISEGVDLFALAGMYASFDGQRVADRSAAQAKTVLIMNTFARVPQDKKTKFAEANKQTTDDPAALRRLCGEIRRIGPPNYYPAYMILHGIKAFTGNPHENALVPDFDAAGTWKKLQGAYLHCPE
jgi:hypothetical protein